MADFYAILPGAKLAPGGAVEAGNKAWNLMRLAQAGLPVPPAFVLPVDWCQRPVAGRHAAMRQALASGMLGLEAATGRKFGGANRTLLVSVRSGAAVSMPGMMETVLDVGLNSETVEGLIRLTGNPRLAWDSFRRLIQGYAEVVQALPTAPFDALVAAALRRADVQNERELDHRDLKALTMGMLECYRRLAGADFPADPHEQLAAATEAVFHSWSAPKASTYRHLNGISDATGTAVTVQTMVYGNAGALSGAGVGFTRSPATGAKAFYFDFKFNAQGEDVVAGRQKLSDNARLPKVLPAAWAALQKTCQVLEALFADVQDFEFTIQESVLFILQTRRAKRTPWAAVAIAVDMVGERLITPREGLTQLAGIDLAGVVRTSFGSAVPEPLAIAEVASMGVAGGALALDTAAVQRFAAAGQPAILVRAETVTADIEGMALAAGILTGSGGRTSHAAVVARQLGKVCLVACPDLEIDLPRRECRIGGRLLKEGDLISLDGNTGAIHPGLLTPTIERPEKALAAIAAWKVTVPA
jgi:pyruvate,orthophosphate dikinase